ncbi:VanW family protein [Virgibacillus siamensis]|uniref:VanW family protein n=1 Tax=Virgibacillus siamensis TaxID=480071 RepID=UPI00098456F4|nr:VanW family protein [Virgibacillus siamensis]
MKTVILSFIYASMVLVNSDGDAVDELDRDDYKLSYLDELFINEAKLKLEMNILEEKVHKNPVNAKLDDNGEIIPEKPGKRLNRYKFRRYFMNYFYTGQRMKKELPVEKVFPRVDSELLAEIKEQKIGDYVTFFKPSNKERSHNIDLAAEAIDNHVVFPGETFSFNKVVGKRTKEKGYKRAPVIVRGELSEDIGGGICQVSSTLFNAVDLKGIEITERYSHSRRVPYVPSGRDATVSWYGPDFEFKNTYNQALLIRASSKNGRMQVSIYSSDAL